MYSISVLLRPRVCLSKLKAVFVPILGDPSYRLRYLQIHKLNTVDLFFMCIILSHLTNSHYDRVVTTMNNRF